jgi:hypothetical protein
MWPALVLNSLELDCPICKMGVIEISAPRISLQVLSKLKYIKNMVIW